MNDDKDSMEKYSLLIKFDRCSPTSNQPGFLNSGSFSAEFSPVSFKLLNRKLCDMFTNLMVVLYHVLIDFYETIKLNIRHCRKYTTLGNLWFLRKSHLLSVASAVSDVSHQLTAPHDSSSAQDRVALSEKNINKIKIIFAIKSTH